MFGNKETKPRAGETFTGTINIIGVGTEINGDVISSGDIRIDGNINGKIISKAKVVIGPSSVVTGDIDAQNADISGRVTGKIVISETLVLKSSANIQGDITVNKLLVESGAEFNGNCRMNSSVRMPGNEKVLNNHAKNGSKVLQPEEAGV